MNEDTPQARLNLEEAWRLTHGDRKASYGDVRVAFERYAKVWSGLLGAKLNTDLTASDVALLMTGLKLAREMNKQASDNVTDAHGYLILHDEIKHQRDTHVSLQKMIKDAASRSTVARSR